MSQDMHGVVADIIEKLRNGSLTPDEAKRFARRENPFEPKSIGTFNPETFIEKGWTIVGKRKVLPDGWNPALLKGVSALKDGEQYITGDEAKKRLAGENLLGVEAFSNCWDDRNSIPAELRGKLIFFDGDDLRSPGGYRYSLFLHWDGDGWLWDFNWRDDGRDSDYVSACAR